MPRSIEVREKILEMMCQNPEGISLSACARELGISLSYATRCLYDPCGKTYLDKTVQDKIVELRYTDGLTVNETAKATGTQRDIVNKIAPGYPGKISNKKLRERVLDSSKSYADICRSLGWTFKRAKRNTYSVDVSRLKRTLGISPEKAGKPETRRKFIDVEFAIKIAEAIGIEPWEVGVFDDEDQHINTVKQDAPNAPTSQDAD